MKHTTAVITNTAAVTDLLRVARPGPDRFVVIPNAVEPYTARDFPR